MKPTTAEVLRRLARTVEVREQKLGATHRHWIPPLPHFVTQRWAIVLIRETKPEDAP